MRSSGVAEAVGEREPDLNALAAPVIGRGGELVAILGLQGPAARLPGQHPPDAARAAAAGRRGEVEPVARGTRIGWAMLGARGRFRSMDLRDLADEELMQLVVDGEVRAFEVIFDRHAVARRSRSPTGCAGAGPLLRTSSRRRFCRCGGAAPATTQARQRALVGAERRSQPGDRRLPPARARGPAATCTTTAIAERLPAPDSTDAEVVRRDDARQVRTALDELPPDQRQVIELAYFGGFTHNQIADDARPAARYREGKDAARAAKMRYVLGEEARVIA